MFDFGFVFWDIGGIFIWGYLVSSWSFRDRL